jgi:hypothetical protein
VSEDRLFDADDDTLTLSLTGPFTSTGYVGGTIILDEATAALTGEGLDGESVNTLSIEYSAFVVACNDPFADADGDGDVDQSDFGRLQQCLSFTPSPATGCGCFDHTGDGRIDTEDLPYFTACMVTSGAGVPADPTCDD